MKLVVCEICGEVVPKKAIGGHKYLKHKKGGEMTIESKTITAKELMGSYEAQRLLAPVSPGQAAVLRFPRAGWTLPWGLNLEMTDLIACEMEKLHSVSISAEAKSVVRKLDERQKVEVKIASGTAADKTESKLLSAPSGEVLYLKELQIIVPVETKANFEFPAGVNYSPTDLSPGTHSFDFVADLGTELRSPSITCKLTSTVTLTADRTATFTPKGRTAKKIY